MTGTTEPAIDWQTLRATAKAAATHAHAPYSGLHVGAAGWVRSGHDYELISACNVEFASYGLTLCAECGLISAFHMLGAGALLAVAVADDTGAVLAPCGRCRQILVETAGPGLLVDHVPEPVTVGDLLPAAFTATDLPDC